MALTPEDVLNKQFTATSFRKGYDEREVDDFLDEVVSELRRLTGENDSLRAQLNGHGPAVDGARDGAARFTGEPSDEELQQRAAAVKAAEQAEAEARQRAQAAEQAEREAQERIQAAARAADQAEAEARRRAEAASEAQDAGDGSAVAVAATAGAGGAAGVIALAQKLHDEYVGEGQATRDRLVEEGESHHARVLAEAQARHDALLSEGQSRHDELISTAQTQHDELIAEARSTHGQMITEARERSTGMVAEAEQRRQAVLSKLKEERDQLAQRVESLKEFERDYRSRLRTYIESQLGQLDNVGSSGSARPEGATDAAGQPESGSDVTPQSTPERQNA